MISGRLAWVRAESERLRDHLDEAATWAKRALELALESGRRKYEAASRATLGSTLAARGDHEAALDYLRVATSIADTLGSPLLRWQARAALGSAERLRAATGAAGETHVREAAQIIREVAGSLSPERSAGYLAAPDVVATLEAAS